MYSLDKTSSVYSGESKEAKISPISLMGDDELVIKTNPRKAVEMHKN